MTITNIANSTRPGLMRIAGDVETTTRTQFNFRAVQY